ncbi:MAG: hypothetical protein MZV64_23970 [Ignavibacteriales bacterium]|nr:hypothetical protein [Ignavibacteriales bacterium]
MDVDPRLRRRGHHPDRPARRTHPQEHRSRVEASRYQCRPFPGLRHVLRRFVHFR